MNLPGNLDTEVEGVPRIMNPVWWDSELEITHNINTIERWMADYERLLPVGCRIDEAAILTPSPYHANALGDVLRWHDWEKFNSASDLVYTNPFGTRYFVEYSFYRHERKNYRLEVMHMGEGRMDGTAGFSPLHAALWLPNGVAPNTAGYGRYPVPHLSFKPVRKELRQLTIIPSETTLQTWGQAYGKAVAHLQEQGCIHAQSCQSTYGRFGYYLPNDAQRQLYIKPRINTRDDA